LTFSISISKVNENQVIELYSAAVLFEDEYLSEQTSNLFISMLNKENIFKLFNEIIIEKSMLRFKPHFIDFFVDELDSVINQKEFEDLEKDLILEIFKKKEKTVEELLKKLDDSDLDSDTDSE